MAITIIVGSTLGSAEYLSDHIESELKGRDFEVNLHYHAKIDEILTACTLLVVTSTHGVGEIPENLAPVFDELEGRAVDLSDLRFAVVALGSRDYDLFCGAYDRVAHILREKGAKELCDPLKIDCSENFDHDGSFDEWADTLYSALKRAQ